MDNEQYNSDKVEQFKLLYKKMFENIDENGLNKSQKYINSLQNYTNIIKTLITNYQNPSDKQFLTDNSGKYYYLSPEKVLYKTSGGSFDSINSTITDIPESSMNSLIDIDGVSSNIYYSNVMLDLGAGITSTNFTPINNKFVQMGVDELTYYNTENLNNDSAKNDIYKLNSSTVPDITNAGMCEFNHVIQCGSYAKMNKKKYYGIGMNDGNCECYSFGANNKPLTQISSSVVSLPVRIDGTNDGTPIQNLNYFGVMADGSVYGLKESNFSANISSDEGIYMTSNTFADDYETKYNDSKYFKFLELSNSNCNPFTGTGVNHITKPTPSFSSNCPRK